MRELSELEKSRIQILVNMGIPFTLIEPTETGLKKSIMDATSSVRDFLLEQNLHDYSIQKQGASKNKVIIKAFLLNETKIIESKASLYRPETKKGDPRIWFSHLSNYAKPNDILAIINKDMNLYVINISNIKIEDLLQKNNNVIGEFINDTGFNNDIAKELLNALKIIAKQGPLKSDGSKDTAIGRAIETALGIKMNCDKIPDYKGIEIKSGRNNISRVSLFAQVPDWNISKFKSSKEILDAFGYMRGDIKKLYCTVSAKNFNSQGLRLKINSNENTLIEYSNNPLYHDFAKWRILKLKERLLEKHKETFWISADNKIIDGVEYFTLRKIKHSRQPIPSQFLLLLDSGGITLDHLIKYSNNQTKEKGPLFKIKEDMIDMLFPKTTEYML